MKFFLGLIVGIVVALLVGLGAMALAVGNIGDAAAKIGDFHIGDRDKSADISKTYDLKDFDKIDVAGVYELHVNVGGDYAIEISGPQTQMDRVEVSVSNGELRLDERQHETHWRNHRSLTATITVPALSAVDISGVVDGEIKGVASDSFSSDISGVGHMEIDGTCGRLKADVSGVGELNAEDLKCKNVDVEVSGVGKASVYASEAVKASVNGMGEIRVSGSPAQVEKSGGLFSKIRVE